MVAMVVAMKEIFCSMVELVDFLLTGDLSAGIVDSSGEFSQFMDWGWFGVN